MYATALPNPVLATIRLCLQPLLNGRTAVADVATGPVPDRSVASVSPAIQCFDRNAEHLGQLWQSHQPLNRFLAHDHLPFSSGYVGGPPVEASDGTFPSQALDSSYLATSGGQVAGSRPAADNRCR